MKSTSPPRVLLPLLAAGAALLAGCEEGATGPEAGITRTRVAKRAYGTGSPTDTIDDRFGGQLQRVAPPARPARAKFTYVLPEGWKALPPRQFRDINLVLADTDSSQLTVTSFPDRGGLKGNIDRWRAEMGKPPTTEAELEGLETIEVLGEPAVILDMSGPYKGMGALALEEARFFGAVGKLEEQTLFVKMIVPGDRGEEQRAVFEDFLAGLQGEMVAPESAPAIPKGSEMPASHPPLPGAATNAGGDEPAPARESRLGWTSPAGWSELPSTNMFREVTFRKGAVEMYASFARGDVGPNVNRWAGQLGMAALDGEALAALPRVETLGTQAVVFEGEGALSAMGSRTPKPGQRMIAAVAPLEGPGGTLVTLKMTGPDADVAAARDDFMSVLTSLQLDR